jgi:hypothetical protein
MFLKQKYIALRKHLQAEGKKKKMFYFYGQKYGMSRSQSQEDNTSFDRSQSRSWE